MRFHGNQISWAIKHPFISSCLKYHSPGLIFSSTMLAPVISSLDEIYCMLTDLCAAFPGLKLAFPGLNHPSECLGQIV